jgi:hypothetical protein
MNIDLVPSETNPLHKFLSSCLPDWTPRGLGVQRVERERERERKRERERERKRERERERETNILKENII